MIVGHLLSDSEWRFACRHIVVRGLPLVVRGYTACEVLTARPVYFVDATFKLDNLSTAICCNKAIGRKGVSNIRWLTDNGH